MKLIFKEYVYLFFFFYGACMSKLWGIIEIKNVVSKISLEKVFNQMIALKKLEIERNQKNL